MCTHIHTRAHTHTHTHTHTHLYLTFPYIQSDGESKVLMFVQLSPVEKNAAETQCSLLFAERAMVIELGQAQVHKESDSSVTSDMKLKMIREN